MRRHDTAQGFVGSAFGTYIPQQLISATEVGSLFVARTIERGAACLLRVLSLSAGASAAEQEEHAARFQHAAERLRQVQHPYLLPLADAGVVGDVPYLVWPLIAMRPLASMDGRVAPVDIATAGRYLDEIAAALEYAHTGGLIHGNLALEGVYAQGDGRLLIGDLGVRQLIELLRHDMQWHYLYTLADPSAPEQTLGRHARSATDVYLLGCMLFRLLTGRHVFVGETREDVAHAHLHDPVPPLSMFRADLPPALDRLLAAALTKEPESRIQRPGELANAFHEIIAPGDVTRIPFTMDGPTQPLARVPSAIPMTRPLTYGPFSPTADDALYPFGNGANGPRPTGAPRWTGAPFAADYGPAAPSADMGAGAANSLHPDLPRPSLPQPSPRLTRPPALGTPTPTSRPLINSAPAPVSRSRLTNGPAPTSRPLITSRPLNPSQPMSRLRAPSQPMSYVRAPSTSRPMAPPRNPTMPPLSTATGPVPPMRITAAPARGQGGRGPARSGLKLVLIPLLIVLIAVGGGLALRYVAGSATAGGQVVFADDPLGPPGVTDALTISAVNLGAPAQGSHYAAWLLNSRTEQAIPLGSLVPAADGKSYTLSFDGASDPSATATNLLGAGDTVEITVETGSGSLPAGRVVLVGSFPPRAFMHISHLLLAFPAAPGGVGILTGALRQAALVDAQAKALLAASNSGDQASVRCYAQSVVNIIEGSKGSDYRALPPDCAALKIAAGDGYGLIDASAQSDSGYLDEAVLHAALAATQPDATPTVQQHAQRLDVAVDDAIGWLRDAQSDALALLASPGDQARAQQLQTLADDAYHGTDANGNGRVDPVQGEAGIATAYTEAQLMATITLAPRA